MTLVNNFLNLLFELFESLTSTPRALVLLVLVNVDLCILPQENPAKVAVEGSYCEVALQYLIKLIDF